MLISTRGRYALRVIIDLAEHNTGKYIPMKDVAEREGISLKYLERILPDLKNAGIIEGVHGKGGGYRLCAQPGDIRVGDVLRLTEGDLAPVTCLEAGSSPCDKASECRTLPLWAELNRLINDYFDSKTIADLMEIEAPDNYVI